MDDEIANVLSLVNNHDFVDEMANVLLLVSNHDFVQEVVYTMGDNKPYYLLCKRSHYRLTFRDEHNNWC